jgi:hypothetical protein
MLAHAMRYAALFLLPALLSGADNPDWPRHVIAEGFNSQTAAAADFTGDGRVDVIADAEGETRLFVAPDWTPIVLDRGHDTIHGEVLDVDGDGDADYIGAVYSPGPVFWLEQPAKPLTEPWPFRIVDDKVNGTHGLIRGDIDGDGKLDLVGNSAQAKDDYPNSIVWWSIPKSPKTAPEWDRHVFADQDAPGLSHYMGIGDIDGDGKADVSAAGKDAPAGGNWFAWWKQPADGSTPWLKRTIAVNQIGATNILPADLNGDGVMDLFATRGHGKGVLWFEGPAPDFKLHEIDPELAGPHDLAIGDIDGDGDIDAATCGKDSYVAAWYENDGRGGFSKHVVYDDQAVYDIRLVDMDNDRDLDILIAGQSSKNVVWYENRLKR